jgi:glucose-1-phosphate adenylyltransferase
VKIKRCIVDENCVIPDDMEIGYDPVADKERFFVTRRGVVLVTQDMLSVLPQVQRVIVAPGLVG